MKPMHILLAALVLTGAALAQEAEIDSSAVTTLGQTVPEFTMTTLDGQTLSMSDLRGKVVWLNFFATWCPPCKQEMPELQKRVWDVFKNEDFFLVSIGREETVEKITPFRDERNLTFPMAPDTDRSIYARFATKFIPRNVLVDKQGRIIHQSKGFSEQDFAELIDKARQAIKQ